MNIPIKGSEIKTLREDQATPVKPPYKEITDRTYNSLLDSLNILDAIIRMLEGSSEPSAETPQIQCFRDALNCNREASERIQYKLNVVSEMLGV